MGLPTLYKFKSILYQIIIKYHHTITSTYRNHKKEKYLFQLKSHGKYTIVVLLIVKFHRCKGENGNEL